MTGGRLSGRLRKLEAITRRKEDPKARYLRALMAYLPAAREARQTGSPEKAREALALREDLEAKAGAVQP